MRLRVAKKVVKGSWDTRRLITLERAARRWYRYWAGVYKAALGCRPGPSTLTKLLHDTRRDRSLTKVGIPN